MLRLVIRVSAAVAVVAGGLLIPGILSAQPYAQQGTGVSTTYSYFDPTAPLPPSRAPQLTGSTTIIARPPVIPEAEYEQRKSVPPLAPQGLIPTITSRAPDSTVAPLPRIALALSPSVSFEGLAQTNYTPPSPGIAVGPDDIIQTVNAAVTHYTRTGQQVGTPVDMTQWFSGLMPTVCSSGSCILGDLTITYDQIHGRFILMLQARDSVSHTSYLLLSVSNGATYASGWKNWALDETVDGSAPTTNWADFPQPGLDGVAFYATTLQFSFSAGTYQYSKVRIFNKTDLYNPAGTSLGYKDLFNLKNEDNTLATTLQVPHLRGRTEFASSTGYMVNSSDVDQADYYTLWQINDPTGTPSLTRTTIHNVWKYGYPTSAPQLGSSIRLDTGPASIARAIMRDGLIYFALNTGYTDEPVTVTYSVMDAVNKKLVTQQRLSNGNFFYPAFDVPASVGPGGTLPNNPIVGTTTGPTGTLTYPGIMDVEPGQTAYNVSGNGSTARWGDYFSGAVDPILGGLWVTGEFAKGTSTWGTWNAYLPWETSQEFTDVPSSAGSFSYINAMHLWNITGGCSATQFCPGDTVTRGQMSVFLIRALYGDNFTFSATPYFTDVPATDAFFPYIQKMKEQGLTSGCSATTFCPGDPITRWQAAIFITRAKMIKLFGDNFAFPTTPYFSDVPATDGGFRFVQKMREMGYTSGCGGGQFCPNQPLTREAAGIFIVRAFLN